MTEHKPRGVGPLCEPTKHDWELESVGNRYGGTIQEIVLRCRGCNRKIVGMIE